MDDKLCASGQLRWIIFIDTIYKGIDSKSQAGLPEWRGTATAHILNGIHRTQGAQRTKKQLYAMIRYFGGSFFWALGQWLYSGGMASASFHYLGVQLKHWFYFDFSATFVATGMICPHITNFSFLLGGIISWAVIWPYISTKEGDWYKPSLSVNDLRGIQGYKVLITVVIILGDGMYKFVKLISPWLGTVMCAVIVKCGACMKNGTCIMNFVAFAEGRATSVFRNITIGSSVSVTASEAADDTFDDRRMGKEGGSVG